MRLNRFLAAAGVGSRRHCDELIAAGKVTINGKICTDFSAQPEARDHVFEPFYTTKEVGRGTGLGLDTARRIVEERHGGSLSFVTGDDGTTFHVWLPLR